MPGLESYILRLKVFADVELRIKPLLIFKRSAKRNLDKEFQHNTRPRFVAILLAEGIVGRKNDDGELYNCPLKRRGAREWNTCSFMLS